MIDVVRENIRENHKSVSRESNKIHNINDLHKQTINITVNEKTDIVVEGLGFFTVKKGTFAISTFKEVNIFIRKAMI